MYIGPALPPLNQSDRLAPCTSLLTCQVQHEMRKLGGLRAHYGSPAAVVHTSARGATVCCFGATDLRRLKLAMKLSGVHHCTALACTQQCAETCPKYLREASLLSKSIPQNHSTSVCEEDRCKEMGEIILAKSKSSLLRWQVRRNRSVRIGGRVHGLRP